MDQPDISLEEQEMLNGWMLQDVVDLQQEKQEIEKERRELERERKRLESMEKNILMRESLEKQRREREEQLFQMKWKMLENELVNLAEEKKKLEIMQAAYTSTPDRKKECGILFSGVHNELALKKRYKDLMKIFHPDNLAGDHDVVVEIGKEYEELQEKFDNDK